MKLVMERADLLRAVEPAARVIQRRNLIPILDNIRLAAEGSEITVTATDLDIEIRTMAPAQIDVPGGVTVPAALLHDLLRRLPDGSQIAMEMAEDGRLGVKCGRSYTRMPTLPASDYPDITPGDMTHRFEMPAEALAALMRDTVFAASNAATLQHICGVHLHQVEGEAGPQLASVATDGHRMLARRVTALPDGAEAMPSVTIPTKTVGEIARLIDKAKGEVAIALCPAKIRIILGQTVMTSSLISGSFPNYVRIVPTDITRRITVEASALASAIDRVGIIADADTKRGTTLSFGDRLLTLTMANQASGDLREEIECDYEGEPFAIGFDHRYLSRILGIVGGDTVLLKVGPENTNTMISTREGSDMFALLAPMRA